MHPYPLRFNVLISKTLLSLMLVSCSWVATGQENTTKAQQKIAPEAAPALTSTLVVVHTDDETGNKGDEMVKSCAQGTITIVEDAPLDDVHASLLVMHYDNRGKIVGVYFGLKDVCQFIQNEIKK